MAQGQVSGHQALLNITFQLANQPELVIEYVIDTGFVGFLTLPPAAVSAMNLPFIRRMPANLADDSTIHLSVHVATILWDGLKRDVEVLATGSQPLLGTLLLDGHHVNIEFTDGGLVSVEDLQI